MTEPQARAVHTKSVMPVTSRAPAVSGWLRAVLEELIPAGSVAPRQASSAGTGGPGVTPRPPASADHQYGQAILLGQDPLGPSARCVSLEAAASNESRNLLRSYAAVPTLSMGQKEHVDAEASQLRCSYETQLILSLARWLTLR
jgi:hypothetical protein